MLSKAALGLRAFAVAAFATLAFGSAQAVQISCPDDVADAVTGTSDCEWSDQMPANNGEATVETFVNTQQYFGVSDWTFDSSLAINGGASGTWDISGLIQDTWEDVMLIFKSSDSPLVGYLVADGVTSGTWETMFTDPPFDLPGGSTEQNVSFIRVFWSEEGVPGPTPKVPEPTTILLLGAGLLAAGLVRRRRRD